MAKKNPTWNWAEVQDIIRDAIQLGKQIARNADYYSLNNPMADMKAKVLQNKLGHPNGSNKPTKPKKAKNVFIDASSNIWLIKKESLPKKRGIYQYYIAETMDGKHHFRERLRRDILKNIKEKFGEWEK